MHTVEPLVL